MSRSFFVSFSSYEIRIHSYDQISTNTVNQGEPENEDCREDEEELVLSCYLKTEKKSASVRALFSTQYNCILRFCQHNRLRE